MSDKHIHKVIKQTLKGNVGKYTIYKCISCPFYVHTKLSFGRVVICWRCGEPFLLERKHTRLQKPHCDNCTKKQEINIVGDLI